jgi:C4-dicarboxylate-binding protein DctP
MRALRSIGAVAVLCALAAAGCGHVKASKAGGGSSAVTLRVSTSDADGAPGAVALEELGRQLVRLSHGRIHLQIVLQAAGRDPRAWDQQVARQVRRGTYELGLVAARAWDTEGVTSLEALSAPFLVTTEPLARAATSGTLAEQMLAGLGAAGVVGLALWPESLRHPFGFGAPLVSPDDFRGATVRVPRSTMSDALFGALGATTLDLTGAELRDGVADGRVAAAESDYYLARTLVPGQFPIVAGNVTLYPKVQTLVIGKHAWARLTTGDRAILQQAARATAARAAGQMTPDAAAAATYCHDGGTVALASDADLAALRTATTGVVAQLASNPATRQTVRAIEELASREQGGTGAAVAACSPPPAAAPAGAPTDPALLNGTWRMLVTYEEGIAAGLDPSIAGHEMGLQTMRLRDGRIHSTWRARDGENECDGTYEVIGDVVTFRNIAPCSGETSAKVEITHDALRWRQVQALGTSDPVDQLVNELLFGKPWRRIGA